jgi:hypothetical protein
LIDNNLSIKRRQAPNIIEMWSGLFGTTAIYRFMQPLRYATAKSLFPSSFQAI